MTEGLALKRLTLLIPGQSPPSQEISDFDGHGLPFLQGNAEFGQKHPLPRLRCDRASRRCAKGDVLVSIRAPVGALNIADRAYGIGRGLCAVRAVDVHPRFLWWLLHARVAELHAVATGSTYEAVTGEDVGALRIGVTSLAGQRAIADYLDLETSRIDVLIAKKRRMIELLNERWQSTMAESISGELLGLPQASPTGIPWLPTMPADWRRAQLNLIARLGSGHTPSRQHPEWWEDTTIPWITTGEVSQVRDDRKEYLTETREKISEIGLANSAAELHPADTVVLCRTASAGYSAIMGTNMATSQDFATWTCGPLLRPRFLLLCLRVMRQDLLGRLAMGSTHKTIYMPDIESILVPLPSVEVQDSVVEEAYSRLPAVDASIDLLARQIVLLVEHRQALITAAVTGEIDIAGAAA